jgi:hypothetical protein
MVRAAKSATIASEFSDAFFVRLPSEKILVASRLNGPRGLVGASAVRC